MPEALDRASRTAGPAGRVVLDVLPLKDGVLLPTVLMPLFVGRARSLSALRGAMARDNQVLLVSQKDPSQEEPGVDDLHQVGTVARIIQTVPVREGMMKVLVEGLYRARIVSTITEDPLSVEAEVVVDHTDADVEAQALRRAALERLSALGKISGRIPDELVGAVAAIPEPGRVADALAGNLETAASERQALLETQPVEKRLERVLELLEREIEIAKAEKKIRGRVKKSIENQSREHYLREQMKAIRKELGDGADSEDELETLKKKIAKAKMPAAVEKQALKELDRLSTLGPGSPETAVIRNYLQVMVELPWSRRTKDRLDLPRARAILERDHAGLKEPKERVLDFLSVCQLKGGPPSFDITGNRAGGYLKNGPILCFTGPPGVGKTSLGRSIARALGRKFGRISLGGMRDEAEIRGHRRTYIGAMPGRLVQTLRRLGANNPVILLDEIDKTGSDWRGDTASALLEVLDPEQNGTFTDHYLEVPFDLSKVLFITTANVMETIPDALRDRMEVIRVAGYTEPEKVAIARRHLLPKQRKAHGIGKGRLKVSRKALACIVSQHTREAGVRDLDRKLAQLCRKVARTLVEQGTDGPPVKVLSTDLVKWLGTERFRRGQTKEKQDEIGLVMGLAWTPVGGTTLPIEAVAVPGSGKLILTGQLGQVMQESAHAAITYARAHAANLCVSPGFHKDLDVHVHAPEGGIPKDGPSAGITIATAVVSALSGLPVSRDVAMTGEITLRGRVLPVGGIKEKVMAAFRAGFRRIVMSEDNRKDLEDVPDSIRSKLRVRHVTHLSEVLEEALVRTPEKCGDGHTPATTPSHTQEAWQSAS